MSFCQLAVTLLRDHIVNKGINILRDDSPLMLSKLTINNHVIEGQKLIKFLGYY